MGKGYLLSEMKQMPKIKDPKITIQIEKSSLTKDEFESILKKACGKPITKPSAKSSKT